MTKKVDTSLTVSVGEGGSRFKKDLILETPYQVFYGMGRYYVVYLYPAVNADLKTSQGGSLVYAPASSTKNRTVSDEYIKFSGGTRAKTRYPAGTSGTGGVTTVSVTGPTGSLVSGGSGAGVQIAKVWATFYDEDGNTVSPTFSYDFTTGEVVSSVKCYGAIRVTYVTSYRVLHYTPNTSYDYRQGFTLTVDTLVAFYQGAVAELAFSASFVESTEDPDYQEVIKVYSEIVVDEEGAWEVPDDFPDATEIKYNNATGYPGPSRAAFLMNQRVVLIVYASIKKSRLYERRFSEKLEQPFSPSLAGGHWYDPSYRIDESIPSDATPDFQLEIIDRVNELKTQYGIS